MRTFVLILHEVCKHTFLVFKEETAPNTFQNNESIIINICITLFKHQLYLIFEEWFVILFFLPSATSLMQMRFYYEHENYCLKYITFKIMLLDPLTITQFVSSCSSFQKYFSDCNCCSVCQGEMLKY